MEQNKLKKRHVPNGKANGTPVIVGDKVSQDSNHQHDHDHEHDSENVDALLEVLKGRGDRGSRIAFLGLLANIGLTGIKGVSGWYLNSAALIADAAHSLSDLMGDIVTLVCYSLSRRAPSPTYPYGYGKFETFGTTIMSLFLLAGASAIAAHSYSQCPPLPFLTGSTNISSPTSSSPSLDEHEDVDPNAAWFALLSILAKEYLYRLSSKVAREENSPVLMANALHHRSDMWSSFVSLVAILGSWLVPGLPLDPLGGILVSVLILQQGLGILFSSIKELTDAGVPSSTLSSISALLKPLSSTTSSSPSSGVIVARDIRAIRRGGGVFVDLTVELPRGTGMQDALVVEEHVRKTVMESRKEVREVRVQFCVEGEVSAH